MGGKPRYIFYTQSQGVMALVSASAAETVADLRGGAVLAASPKAAVLAVVASANEQKLENYAN